MKIYIAGRVTGDKDYREKFSDASYDLRVAGYRPFNPASFIPDGMDWNEAMRTLLCELMRCDGVALLHDWEQSRGAKIEARIAREVGIPVKPIGKWLKANNV